MSPDQIRAEQHEEDIQVAEDYQALSSKEEADLKKMMGKCEYAIGNAEAFVERLANDLSVLDGVSIFINFKLIKNDPFFAINWSLISLSDIAR